MALYLLNSTACFIILFIVYLLMLRNTTFFQYNRFYLLAAAVMSLVFPLIPTFGGPVKIPHHTIEGIMISANLEVPDRSLFPWINAMMIIYFIGVVVNLFLLIVSTARVMILIRSSRKFLQNGLYFLPENSSHTAFSFFRKIFIHPNLDIITQGSVIAHEKVHARQLHTLDIIFYEVLCAIFWFNPFYWLAKKQLAATHEFIADAEASGNDKLQYAHVLAARALDVPYSAVVNSFSLSNNLKRRLIMLQKTKTNRANLARYAAIIPLMIGMLFFNSFTIIPADKVYDTVDKMPEFKGGQQEMINYLSTNIKYPEEAKKANLTGKVMMEFVVDKKGSIKDVKVLKSDNIIFDAEALRVISSMPDWVPGEDKGKKVSVKLVLPISFML